jgi:hypothetical protein
MPAEARGFSLSPGQLATMRALAIDRVTAEVVSAFGSAGVPCILLKGPTLADWLYERGALRPYVDSDLLVRPDQVAAAERILAELGFAPETATLASHGMSWRRADGAMVDLHMNLPGLGLQVDAQRPGPLPAEKAWSRLAELTEPMSVGGTTVMVLTSSARALLVVLHAAHHGAELPQPLEDLSRALERLDYEEWRVVVELAWQLEATPNLTRGLRLLPQGAELADQLGLPSSEFVEAVVDSATGPGSHTPLTLGFERLASARDSRARFALVLRELFPSPAFMREWSRLPRYGPPGLVVAYVWRLLWILGHAVPSLMAWRRARQAIERDTAPRDVSKPG